MDPVEFEFPLTKLPLLAREHVYRTMDGFDRVATTLSNKRVKKEIKGLRLYTGNMTINISDAINFCPEFWPHGHYSIEFDDPDQFFESDGAVYGYNGDPEVYEDEMVCYWNYPWLSGIDWFRHFIEIFDVKEISLSVIDDCETFNVADVLQCFRAIKILKFEVSSRNVPTDHLQELIEAFPANRYYFNQDPFEDKTLLHNFLSKGFDGVTFQDTISLDLSDVLVMSCITAEIRSPTFTGNDINVFLRVWMAGWNTTLKFLMIRFEKDSLDENYLETMLNGLEHTLVEQERRFDIPTLRYREFRNGYDLVRSDGMKATLYSNDGLYGHYNLSFDMFFMVWP